MISAIPLSLYNEIMIFIVYNKIIELKVFRYMSIGKK